MIVTPSNMPQLPSQRCSLRDGVKKIKETITRVYKFVLYIFEGFHLTGKILRRKFWDKGGSFSCPKKNESADHWMRRNFHDKVKLSPDVGLDPRISEDFFLFTAKPLKEIPEPPDEDINDLVKLFDEFVAADSSLIADEDTPATYEELQTGIKNFMKSIIDEKYYNSENLHKLLKHICGALKSSDLSADIKEYWLLELARAGKRQCPTRMNSACKQAYEALSEDIQVESLEDRITQVYHDLRLQIIKEMGKGDVHREGELLVAIGSQLNIHNAELAYNDDPFLIDDLAPQKSLPKFCKKFTAQRIIGHFTKALNAKKIPSDLLWEWFLDNIPSDFHPELKGEERNMAFIDSTEFAEKGQFKEKGIVYLLTKIPTPILNY